VQNLYISKDEETDLELEDGRERDNVYMLKKKPACTHAVFIG
jgi:hypothetical protein